MNKEKIYEELNTLFREVFDNDSIELSDATTANDIAGWDSLMQITLIGAIESEFGVAFSLRQMNNFSNVGEMVNAILQQKSAEQ